jgi:hypothetical protein
MELCVKIYKAIEILNKYGAQYDDINSHKYMTSINMSICTLNSNI